MSPPAPASFARSLAALDAEEFVRFVAALESAREGVTSVERDGGRLVVRGTETRRLLPVAVRRGPLRSPAPVGPVAGPVDEVVAQVGDGAGRSLAARHGARHRSPADLRDLALYGLDRSVGERLLDDHFGDASAGSAAPGRSALVALAAATLLLVAAAVGGGFGATTPESGATADRPAGTPTPAPVAPDGPASAQGAYPPGVNASGVTAPEHLARAHRDVVDDRSYRWVVVGGRTNATWGGRVDVLAVAPEQVLGSAAEQASGADAEGTFTTYAEDGYTYIGIVGANGTQYSREIVRHRPGDDGNFAARAGGYVERYLAAPTGTVTRVEAADTAVYRVRVAGPPPRVDGVVSNYTATAVVTPEGFVVRLDVAYTRHYEGDARAVAFRFAYAPYRDDARPQWYDAARAASDPVEAATATNGTGTEATPTAPAFAGVARPPR